MGAAMPRASSRTVGHVPAPTRRATIVTLPKPLLGEAGEFSLTVSQACEHGLPANVAVTRATRRPGQNRAAMEA
ncbi:type II toxin-antitoxin system CcdA family antitoxin [Lichenicola sp.]|uniref:type II toxin-antitoxin system CcdA family antitoxin n=1 Tax=Lichenicola sp. TaxID=2804529 RepID=UPI003B00F2A3